MHPQISLDRFESFLPKSISQSPRNKNDVVTYPFHTCGAAAEGFEALEPIVKFVARKVVVERQRELVQVEKKSLGSSAPGSF